jgi:hypothetical protein
VYAKSSFAQVVDGITYQAVAINQLDELPGVGIGSYVKNQTLDVRFTIIIDNPGGAIVYQEVQTTTDNFGLFSVVIWKGIVTSTSPNTSILHLFWGSHKHFLKVEIDLKRDGNFELMGKEQMQTVPYALHALDVPVLLLP